LKFDKLRGTVLILLVVPSLLAILWMLLQSASIYAQDMHDKSVLIQQTNVSSPDTLAHNGTQQSIVILPERPHHKIWDGSVTWTASKPVVLRVLQLYNSSVPVSMAHGNLSTTQWGGTCDYGVFPYDNATAAIAYIMSPEQPVEKPGFYSGSMDFRGNQVALYNLEGEPFTATYTVDAGSRSPTE
jgi:hypothetical protein